MAIKVAVVSQKGGVGKSSIARLIGREFADNGWLVNIADMDVQQATSYHWFKRRAVNQVTPGNSHRNLHECQHRFGRYGEVRPVYF